MKQRTESTSIEETIAFARQFAASLKQGDIVRLEGDLGAGKTHFVKGVASHFGISQELVSSPTFTIIHEYEGELPIFHFDCYRLKHEQEAIEIGIEEYLYSDGISLIEWPEKIEELLPSNTIKVQLKHLSENKREIVIY